MSAVRRAEIVESLDDSAALDSDYALLVILSCIIASFGLVVNSTAVTIGAMLIAPLMGPILGMSLSLVRGDLHRLSQAVTTLLIGVAMAILISIIIGNVVSRSKANGFLAELPREMINRTEPTLFDLVVAMAGGFLAAYALTQPRLSPTLPGVAIATSLMPPLCVVGLGISQGETGVSNGALLLFLANFVAIVFSSAVVFVLAGFGPLAFHERRQVLSRTFVVSSVSLFLITIPLANFMVRIADDARTSQIVRETLSEQFEEISADARLVEFSQEQRDGDLHVNATVRTPRELSYEETSRIQRILATKLDTPVSLELLIVPIKMLDAVAPEPGRQSAPRSPDR
ncbi:MAG: TIGR00341 family protein [Thermomicrobiales bacterium]